MASVTLHQLEKYYTADTPVLQDINLSIADGELMVLVGPSGCGKSTLLRLIAGLDTASTGDIQIADQSVAALPPRLRDLAVVFQDYALYPHKTVFDNMAFGLKMQKRPVAYITKRVQEVAELLQIQHLLARKPKDLSGGQRQRVAMGRAMVREPRVFLFDEPLSNLDAQLRTDMRTEIKRLHQRFRNTMIYVTHDQVEAMTLADRIAVMHNGRIEQVGTPEEIYSYPATEFVARFIGSPGMNFLPVRWHQEGNHAALQLGTETIPLSPIQLKALAPCAGQVLHIGIRPEHIDIQPSHQPYTWQTSAILSLIEPLGADYQLTLTVQGYPLMTRVPAHTCLQNIGRVPAMGTVIPIALDLRHLHLFDAQTGNVLSSPQPHLQLVMPRSAQQ